MFTSIEKIKTLKFKLKKKERVNGKINSGEQNVKFNRSPKKIYTKVLSPNKGVEILFVEGQNNNRALVNPNGFPYSSLNLDPYGDLMRKNNHHTVHEVGFDYISSIVSNVMKKSESNFDKIFLLKGDTIFDSKPCYKLLIDYTPFTYISYTVKENETLTSIAYKLFVSDVMILEANKLSGFASVKPGQVIKVPNAYARKTILFIDKASHLPVVQRMYDDQGLFAEYEFYDLEVNPVIAQEEFTRTYKDYKF